MPTRDNNGTCHLMPQRYLPEWREEERAFVHRGSWIPNKGLGNTGGGGGYFHQNCT